MKALMIFLLALGCAGCAAPVEPDEPMPLPETEWAPRSYVSYRTSEPPTIDGRLDEPAWSVAPRTESFVDIECDCAPPPPLRTRAAMLWDDEYFYVAAELEEPHVWGTLEQRDSVIFHDNDFEVFIDPDGDTHEYYELEINALGTVWDLRLTKPYRDDGTAVDAWDITGLKSAVFVDGTLNDGRDEDRSWTVELAIPWTVLAEYTDRRSPPRGGDQWRVNFSRVEWQADIDDGRYVKRIDPETGKPFPENNWVWSAQGLIAMHYPEMWGFVQFSEREVGGEPEPFVPDPVEPLKWELRKLYYAQSHHRTNHGAYASELAALDLEASPDGCSRSVTPEPEGYTATLDCGGTRLTIDHTGRVR